MIIIVNPSSTVSNAASAALITDMQPLIAHAQGILFSSMRDNHLKHMGNGIPIKKAGTAIIINDMTIFQAILMPVTFCSTVDRNKE